MHVARIDTFRNYAWMLRPADAQWNTHFAYCWYSEGDQGQRHDLERLAGKMDSFVVEFSAAEVSEAARAEDYGHLAPVGAQTKKRFALALFDL